MKLFSSFAMLVALALTACATTREPPYEVEPPPVIHDQVRSLGGEHAKPCGIADLANDSERLTGYTCIRSAARRKQPFWFIEKRMAAGGVGFAWIGSPSGKVYQLLSLGKGFITTECRVFEVSVEKGGNIHCSG